MSHSAEKTIAGYIYQFDYSILRILDPSSTQITVEGVEDVDVFSNEDTEAIQVKYYNATKYAKDLVREPISKMLSDFNNRKKENKALLKYTLYIYFGNESETFNEMVENEKFKDLEQLLKYSTQDKDENGKAKRGKEFATEHSVLTDLGITVSDLDDFDYRVLKADKNLEQQKNEIKESLRKEFNCDKDSEIEVDYYYNNAIAVISELACQKTVNGSADNRTISRSDFKIKIDKKVFLFNKWYAALKGSDNYMNYLRKTLKKGKALNIRENKFFFIGKEFLPTTEIDEVTKNNFIELVENIISETYEIAKAFSTKNKVSTLVVELDRIKIEEIKKKLLEKNILFNDGNEHYGFSAKRFNEDPITNTNKNDRLTKASFNIKIISFDTFKDNWNKPENKEKIQPIETVLFFSNQDHQEFFKNITENFKVYVIPHGKHFNSFSEIRNLFEKLIISDDYFRVISVLPNLIQVEVTNSEKFAKKNDNMSIGSYIKITDENQISVIGMLQSYKIRDINIDNEIPTIEKKEPSFILDIQPVGYLENDVFERGGNKITIPPNEVQVADDILLKKIFTIAEPEQGKMFSIGTLSNYLDKDNRPLNIEMDGNKFFNKHIAVLGSTGSGKSCTVAKILQEGIKPEHTEKQKKESVLNNSHILIFDLHGEYKTAFPNGRHLSVKDLVLPYWLMNSDELQTFLLGSELEDGQKKSLLKRLITGNKKMHYSGEKDLVTYDLPVYFSINEIKCYIDNINDSKRDKDFNIEWGLDEQMAQSSGIPLQVKFKEDVMVTKEDGTEINSTQLLYTVKCNPIHNSQSELNGKLASILTRLETQLNDERLNFLFKRTYDYRTEDLKTILSQFLGYNFTHKNQHEENVKSNVTVIDLSGIPFEVINITVALISRLVFSFAYHYKKWQDAKGLENEVEIPFLLVYEEAHNYIPKTEEVKYKSVREAVERIAKEGRKYGLSAMIISQRPSEISETILSQCNSFVVMRLTNPTDQSYVKRLLPDTLNGVTDNLSVLQPREALVIGESIPIPTILKINEVDKDKLPKSSDVPFIEKWRLDWNEMPELDDIMRNMTQK